MSSWIIRFLFIIILISVMFGSLTIPAISGEPGRTNFSIILWGGLLLAIFTLVLDIGTPRKSLASLSGVFFGLVVGIFFSWGLGQLVELINDIYVLELTDYSMRALKWMLGVCVTFLVISVIMKTKDDVRFVIPYVEFSKQTKGSRPLILDTSAIIDGRIADLYKSKLFDSPLIVPRFVLNELQLISDSADKLKRNRGRRGLDILKEMQSNPVIDISIDDTLVAEAKEAKGVDQKLVMFAKNFNGRVATTDYNLTKVAQVSEVDVLNINDLANSLKTIALPGEGMTVKVVKAGEEAEQGIGYLDDGTMVVIEDARNKIGRDIVISITSSLQTSAGKMIFGKFESFSTKESQSRPQQQRNRAYTGGQRNEQTERTSNQ